MELVLPWPDGAHVQVGDRVYALVDATAVPLPPGAAPSPDGARVVWVEGGRLRLGPVGGVAAGDWALPDPGAPEVHWFPAFLDAGRVYLHASDRHGEVDRCWLLDVGTGGWSEPPACLVHAFHAVTGIRRGPGEWWVVDSHAEGTPAVDVQRYDGVRARPAALPWSDLYPYGTAHPSFVGGELWWTSDCDLARPRPCAGKLEGETDGPWRAWRGRPGSRRLSAVEGEVAPGTAWVPIPGGAAPVRAEGDGIVLGR